MIVREPRLEQGETEAIISARFEPDADERPGVLRIGIDPAYLGWVDRNATPFAPVAAVIATAIGEDLVFEAPVSPALIEGATRVSERFARWWGYRPTTIEAPAAPPREPGSAVAALFSGGVDTSATVIRSLRGEIPARITHLISMYGSEFKLSPATHEAIWGELSAAARGHGLPLIRVSTNAPDLLRRRIAWPRSHGATFAGLALSLGPGLSTVLFGASQLPEESRPHGSRADLDHLWSTEATRIAVDGAELGKLGRAAVVATSEVALDHLMVCWKSDEVENCGRCEKCLRTMTCLAVAGALDRCDRFGAPLTAEAVRACEIGRNSVTLIRELVSRLPSEHGVLRAAWEQKLNEGEAMLRAEARAASRRRRRKRRRRTWRRIRRSPRRLARGLAR